MECGYGSHDLRGVSSSRKYIYQWSDFPMESFTSGTDRAHGSKPTSQRHDDPTLPPHPKPSGYQSRDTIGGTSRGQRSSQAKQLRFQKWTQNKRLRRRDYRAWKSALKGTTLRTHGGSIPVPPSSPSPPLSEEASLHLLIGDIINIPAQFLSNPTQWYVLPHGTWKDSRKWPSMIRSSFLPKT